MMTPFDWQEGITHRAQYVEARLATGIPVVVASIEEGILAVTYRRQSRKVFEIYDRLMFSGLGQQSDVESLRVAAIDFCHKEGFQRSEQDVTIQRVVTAMSDPIKRAFADFSSPPVIASSIFAQVGEDMEADRYQILSYEGDFMSEKHCCFLAGTEVSAEYIMEKMKGVDHASQSVDEAIEAMEDIVRNAIDPQDTENAAKISSGLTLEVGLMGRGHGHRNFQLLKGDWD